MALRRFNAAWYDSGCTEVLSSTFLLSGMRKKPAHCSKVFSPILYLFNSSAFELRFVLYILQYFCKAGAIPDTYESSEGEAVFTSTPTLLTQSSTTFFSDSPSLLIHIMLILPNSYGFWINLNQFRKWV